MYLKNTIISGLPKIDLKDFNEEQQIFEMHSSAFKTYYVSNLKIYFLL